MTAHRSAQLPQVVVLDSEALSKAVRGDRSMMALLLLAAAGEADDQGQPAPPFFLFQRIFLHLSFFENDYEAVAGSITLPLRAAKIFGVKVILFADRGVGVGVPGNRAEKLSRIPYPARKAAQACAAQVL